MAAVAEKQQAELVTVPAKETALEVFKADQGLDPYLQTIRAEVDEFLSAPPALDTNRGRQAYASMAHKIARSKTAIDNVGKELVAELKQLPKTIDAERKRWRDTLDQWKDEVRGPLNEWEAAEEARREKHELNIQGLRVLATELEDLDSAALKHHLVHAEGIGIDESWEEYEAEAHRVKEVTVTTLRVAVQKREQYEAERAELAKLRAEQAKATEQEEDKSQKDTGTGRAARSLNVSHLAAAADGYTPPVPAADVADAGDLIDAHQEAADNWDEAFEDLASFGLDIDDAQSLLAEIAAGGIRHVAFNQGDA